MYKKILQDKKTNKPTGIFFLLNFLTLLNL